MKVALITQYFPTSTQPWAGHSAYQTVRLLAARCDVHVFYPEAVYPRGLRPGPAAAATLDRGWHPPEMPVTYVPYPVLPVVSRPLNGLAMYRRLVEPVRRFAPDILLSYVVYPDGYAAVRVGQRLGIPSVITAIGSDLNRISDPLCGRLTRYAVQHANFVTAVSADLARTAERMGANPLTTQAKINGCDTDIFFPRDRDAVRRELGLDAEAEIVLYVGRLDIRKGLRELIDAVAALRVRRPALHCYIVGDGPDRPILTAAIEKHAAAAFITLVPPCVTSRVALWMAAADLVTLPSYKEGCPNVVIEALSSGRPMVATDVGGIPELMDDTCGRLVPVKDVPALVDGLDAVLSHPWDAGAISHRRSRSWNDVAAGLQSVLEETLLAYRTRRN